MARHLAIPPQPEEGGTHHLEGPTPSFDANLSLLVNPCPSGFNLQNIGGQWLCVVNGAEDLFQHGQGNRAGLQIGQGVPGQLAPMMSGTFPPA